MHLPGKRECCWSDTAETTSYATLKHSEKTDVAIVGAGVVGLTAAYLLTRAGLSITVLEARKIGRQVTGRSTAKVTAQHTLIYRYLIAKFGLAHAQLYADANRSGVAQIRSWVDKLGIDCDFEPEECLRLYRRSLALRGTRSRGGGRAEPWLQGRCAPQGAASV